MSNFSNAEELFYDNANYNASLAASNSKVRYKGILWGGKKVTPEEVLGKLKERGLEITQRTLQRYEKAGLIPTPKRGSGGRGKGKFTDYPPETIWETYVAYYFMHEKLWDWSTEKLSNIRRIASQQEFKVEDAFVGATNIQGIMKYEVFYWRLYALYTKYNLPVENACEHGGLHQLFKAIEKDDKEAIRQAYLDRACEIIRVCEGNAVWENHVRNKYNLNDWPKDKDWPEYVFAEPCPREEECIERAKKMWVRDCHVCRDKDGSILFDVYERKPGTDEWYLVAEDKF